MLEALERLLFTSFVQNTGSGEQVQQLFHQTKQLENNLAANVADAIVVSDEFNEVFSQYEAFKEKVRTGLFGKLSQFWIQYMDRVGLLLQFSLATRKNNIDLHIYKDAINLLGYWDPPSTPGGVLVTYIF